MYLHLRFDLHFGTRTQYRSLQTPSSYPNRVCLK
ncbi:unnamed protein product [Schistosoma curassoni]|uniref:Uncharacterized protein n=1 Tax=Schistosoma curassoni TaxID=6186 RepID=A0A183KGD5_9TREM|nr:unnamed protein product [Schistosoma curassoni]